jgi:hypothetical protein
LIEIRSIGGYLAMTGEKKPDETGVCRVKSILMRRLEETG